MTTLDEAAAALARLPASYRAHIRARIDSLSMDPRPPGAALIKGPKRFWRFRVGDYRVLYRILDDSQEVRIVIIGHRREIYRGL